MKRPPLYIVDLNDRVKEYVGEFARWNKDEFRGGIPSSLLSSIDEIIKEGEKILKKRLIR